MDSLLWICKAHGSVASVMLGWSDSLPTLEGMVQISCSVMSDSVTPWTVAHQAPLSLGFSRQEYWRGLHALLQGIFPTQGSNLHLLCLYIDREALYH